MNKNALDGMREEETLLNLKIKLGSFLATLRLKT